MKFDGFEINPVHIDDAKKICDFAIQNQMRLCRFFPMTLKQNLTLKLSQLFVEEKVKQFNAKEEFLFTLNECKTIFLVGLIYLKEIDWLKKQGEFAYCIGDTFEGKGITTKAIKTLINYAFEILDIKTLQIIAHKSNIPSIKVAIKNNFVWSKTLEKAYTPPREMPLDMELYELIKK